jgi:hypothetical protein
LTARRDTDGILPNPTRHRGIEPSMSLALQIVWLFVLAIPTACVAWTITHEEIFHEPRDYCKQQTRQGNFARRKFFYVFTCEYCLSHYVAFFFLLVTRFKLLLPDWRGYLIAFFALVWLANQYMSVYSRLRLDIQHERIEIKAEEEEMKGPQKAA